MRRGHLGKCICKKSRLFFSQIAFRNLSSILKVSLVEVVLELSSSWIVEEMAGWILWRVWLLFRWAVLTGYHVGGSAHQWKKGSFSQLVVVDDCLIQDVIWLIDMVAAILLSETVSWNVLASFLDIPFFFSRPTPFQPLLKSQVVGCLQLHDLSLFLLDSFACFLWNFFSLSTSGVLFWVPKLPLSVPIWLHPRIVSAGVRRQELSLPGLAASLG